MSSENKQYALVTGSSSGLGLEICRYLLEEEYCVFGASRSGTDIDHERFVDLEVDVRSEDSVTEMYNKIGTYTYGLNLIVNNAGVFEMSAILDTTTKEFKNHLETNILGAFHILKYADQYLIEGISHLIYISSMTAQKGYPNIAAYCASYFGLNGFIESAREEFKALSIRFTSLNAGAIFSSHWESIRDDMEGEKILSVEDFIYLFDMVVQSPPNLEFLNLSFMGNSRDVQ